MPTNVSHLNLIMIPITKFSPSSINTFNSCEMEWFLSYVLGYRSPSGKAAAIGTCCHAILEAVGQSKYCRQENKQWCKSKVYGRIYPKYNLEKLIVDGISVMVKENPHIKFTNKDFDEVHSNIEIAKGDRLFPENHKKIVATEHFFNEALDYEWATYSRIEKGKVIEKPIRIAGIIDLVYIDNNDKLNYLDYKFGQPVDWNTRKEKDYSNLQDDIQLCLYYWAVKKKYAQDGEINTNIWYVKHNKNYQMYFDEENIKQAMNIVSMIYARIIGMERPACNYSWKCKAFCPFSKKTFGDFEQPHLDVDVVYADNHRFDTVGNDQLSMCDATNLFFDKRNLTSILENCKNV